MTPKYSESALLKVAGLMAATIVAAIGGIAWCVGKVLDDIT